MPQVELPDGRVAEFPDGASLPEIDAAVRRDFALLFQQAPQPGPKLPFSDLVNPEANQRGPSTISGGPPLSLPSGALRSSLSEIGSGIGETLTHPGIELPSIAPSMETFRKATRDPFTTPEEVPNEALLQVPPSTPEKVAVGTMQGVDELGRGVAEFMTSGGGFSQLGVAATPLAPAVYGKWAVDMGRAGYQSAQDAIEDFKKSDWQKLSKDAVTAFGLFLGAKGAAGHAVKPVGEVITAFDNANRLAPVAASTKVIADNLAVGNTKTAAALAEMKGETPNALQEQVPGKSVLGQERPQVELSGMAEGSPAPGQAASEVPPQAGEILTSQANREARVTGPPTPSPESAAAALPVPETPISATEPNVTSPVTENQLSRGPGAAAAGEPGTYSAISQLADRIEATANENAPVDQKISAIEKAKGMASDLKDGVKSGLANVLAIKKALWDSYTGLAPYTEMKKIVGKWFHANQKADFEAREFGKQIVKAVPDKVRREAITNWIQADGDMAVLKERAGASKGTLKRGYELAQALTPRELDIAGMLRDYYDQQLERGVSEGLLKDGLENYITQIWKKENPITRKLQNELVSSRLQPNFKYAKQRIFESFFEGEQAGYKPMKDAGALVAHYDQSFNKALSARAFIKELHEGKASDGRPLVEVSGSGKLVGEDEPKPKFIIKPKSTPEAIGDYKTIDHPALRGWKWVGKTPEGTDVLMQGELKVHPEIYDKLRNRLSTSWFRQNPAARAVLNVQSTLKQSMLSISGFHQVQEGLHALGHRVNPANLEKLDFSEPVTKSLVEHGLQLSDHNALEQFGEGLSSGNLLNKIPALGPKLKQYNDWLFQEHIPRLKLTMAKHALERNMERYADAIKSGKITADQVQELTASQANHAFGELPYKYWGRNPNLQDFYRTFLLAPDFLEARAGFVGQAMKPGGLGPKGLLKNEQMQALALLALTQYITARVANQIIDQDPHWEMNNAFRIISGNHAYSLRTIPGDVIHLMSDPRGFTYNRLSPVVGRGAIEAVTGRDYRGVKRDFTEQMTDLLKSGIPISLNRKQGATILESFGNAMGVQNQRYDAVQNIQQKIQDFKAAQDIKEPHETIYNIDDDKFAALRLAVQAGRQEQAQAEFDKLKAEMPAAKIKEHFKLSWSRPLTGSGDLDRKFVATLNDIGKQEWKEAQDLRKARIRMVQALH